MRKARSEKVSKVRCGCIWAWSYDSRKPEISEDNSTITFLSGPLTSYFWRWEDETTEEDIYIGKVILFKNIYFKYMYIIYIRLNMCICTYTHTYTLYAYAFPHISLPLLCFSKFLSHICVSLPMCLYDYIHRHIGISLQFLHIQRCTFW